MSTITPTCKMVAHCLVSSDVCITFYRTLRQRDASKFHIQLCIALFCMLIVFVCGINRTSLYEGCVAVSVLIHYFTLVGMMFTGAEAVFMFQKLVIVFIHITTRYIVAVSLVCWCKFPDVKLKQNTELCTCLVLLCSGSNCSSCHSIGH